MNVGNIQLGRPQITKEDLDDMEKAVQTVRYNTISITNADGETSTVQLHWDSDIYDYMERIQRLLMADGFHPETVENGFRYMMHEHYADDTEQATEDSSDDDGYDAEMKHLIRWISENCSEMDLQTISDKEIFNRYLYRNAPSGICGDCGKKYGTAVDEGCTWWRGECTWCLEFKGVTDERDFGYPDKAQMDEKRGSKSK